MHSLKTKLVAGLLTLCLLALGLVPAAGPPTPPAKTTGDSPSSEWKEETTRPFLFTLDPTYASGMSAREQRDQLLDWMLMAAVRGCGLSEEALTGALYDLPPVRRDYLRGVANYEYGVTRSCQLGDGRVVALLPKGTDAEARDHLGAIADSYRQQAGGVPSTVIAFEYELNHPRLRAKVTRLLDVPGAELFTRCYNYHERTVQSEKDLATFLKVAPNVTYLALRDGKLLLGGRKPLARAYRGIRVEDVAALWQAVAKKLPARRAYEKLRQELKAKKIAKFADLTPAQIRTLVAGMDAERGLGFSLDPADDFPALQRIFRAYGPYLIALAADKEAILSREHVEAALAGLKSNRIDPFLIMLRAMSGEKAIARERSVGKSLQRAWQERRFQKARYDGDLQGTEVGMVLYYTDLLMKLWISVDFDRSLPRHAIEGFRTKPDGGNSVASLAERQAFPAGRVWLGLDPARWQKLPGDGGLALAPLAVRLYAASSDTLAPGAEVDTVQANERVNGWWNDHFDEIARYEQEYQRLDQCLKWGLIFEWLAQNKGGEALRFLEGVKVGRAAWFPDWAASNKDLRFQKWDKVGFFEKGQKPGITTEALPTLYSRPFEDHGDLGWTMSGGVTLPPPATVGGRKPLPAESGKRGISTRGLEPDSLPAEGRVVKVRSLKGHEHTIEKGTATTRPAPRTRTRGAVGEIHKIDAVTVETRVTRREFVSTLSLKTKQAGPVAVDGVRIRMEGGEVHCGAIPKERDMVLRAAQRVSAGASPEALRADPGVKRVGRQKDGALLVEFHGGEKVWKLSRGRSEPTITADIEARVAGTGEGAKIVDIACLTRGAAESNPGAVVWLPPARPATTASPRHLRPYVRGPPADLVPKETVRRIAESHKAGRMTEALDLIEQARQTHPDAAELKIMEATVRLALRQPAEAARLTAEAAQAKGLTPARELAGASGEIAKAGGTDEAAAAFFMRKAAANANGEKLPGKMEATPTGLRFRSDETLALRERTPAERDEVIAIYVEHSPGLNNLDPVEMQNRVIIALVTDSPRLKVADLPAAAKHRPQNLLTRDGKRYSRGTWPDLETRTVGLLILGGLSGGSVATIMKRVEDDKTDEECDEGEKDEDCKDAPKGAERPRKVRSKKKILILTAERR